MNSFIEVITINKNIVQKFKYDYINSNDVNKLSNEQRKNNGPIIYGKEY